MRGLINYSDLANLPLYDAVRAICNVSRIRYGDMKLTDLLLSGRTDDLKVSDYWHPKHYGSGVYVFFDRNAPVYVGKAANFLHRLSSHRIIDARPNWGWNALLQKICLSRFNIGRDHTGEHLAEALDVVENFGLIRVLSDSDEVTQRLTRLETIIIKGMKLQHDSVLNDKKKPHESMNQRLIRDLLQ